jgi:hypothetical protein
MRVLTVTWFSFEVRLPNSVYGGGVTGAEGLS